MEKIIAKDLLSIGAVFLRPEEPFTWASGIKSPIYCDNRLTLTAPEVRNHVENGLAEIVKKEYPQLKVNTFGVEPRPNYLPQWYSYYQSPDKEIHNRIYNEAAIFIGCSSVEGWGLPIGEAMICGAAVACTNNKGYLEMAKDGETALVSPIKDAQALANNIIRLIKDDELRHRIARNGNEFIKQFKWDSSYEKLKETIGIQ